MKLKRDIYEQKFFPEGKGIEASEYHMLNIWLKNDVSRDDLLKAGLVEGKEEDDECDCFVYEEDEEHLCVPHLAIPMNGDVGVDQDDLDEYFTGIDVLPDGWEEGVPELIGFKPEWIDGVSMDG